MTAETNAGGSPHPLSLAWKLMAGFRGLYLAGIGLLFFNTLLTMLTPLIGAATLDLLIPDQGSSDTLTGWVASWLGDPESIRSALWVPALWMVSLTALAGLFDYGKGFCAARATEGIARKLKDRLHAHLQKLPTIFHDESDSGDTIQRCTSDVETFRMTLSTQVVNVANAILLLAAAIPLMMLLDLRMTGISLILVFPLIAFGLFYFVRVRHIFRQVDEAEAQVTRRVQENLTGLRVVRAFARQNFEKEQFAIPNALYRDRYLQLIRLMAVYWSLSDWIVLLQQGLVLFAGVYFIAQGSLTVGGLFAFLMFLNLFLWPVRQMGRTLTEIGKSQVAVSRLQDILNAPVEADALNSQKPAASSRGSLQVENLHFRHRSGIPALRGVSFSLEPGQTLAILGPSGSGKSTLFQILLRLYDFTEGSVRIDGQDIRELSRDWVRAQFSVVLQEPFLFSRTVGTNIRLGRESASGEAVMEAAQQAHIHNTIERFPNSYETFIGERGITLSGGQRQRVAIARALLRSTPFLLLDDALSAVDAETEESILRALQEKKGNVTILVIAHRLSTLVQADHILVFEKGQVVQSGTHRDLMERPGLYRRLWEIQTEQNSETVSTL